MTELQPPPYEIASLARTLAGRAQSPATIERTITGLQRCVERFASNSNGTAWTTSKLNCDGCPVEFAFSSADDALRYTLEVAGPELASHARVEAAVRLAECIGSSGPPVDEVRHWRELQAGQALNWGAWVSVRQGTAADRVKLYIEVPPAVRAGATPRAALFAPDSDLLMLGYDCATGTKEYYFRQPALGCAPAVDNFLEHFESAPRRTVMTAFAALCGMPVEAALRWINFGYSVTVPCDGSLPIETLLMRSRSVGNLATVREAFLEHERRSGKAESPYRKRFGMCPVKSLPDHGTIGFIAGGDGGLQMRVGISATALARTCAN